MSVPAFTLRRLGPDDVHTMRALNALFGEAFADRGTYGSRPPNDAYLRALLAEEHVAVVVAMDGAEVVGGLVAYEPDKFEEARRAFYIDDLAVASKHRRRGIATALIGHLRGIAAQRGAWVIYVQAIMATIPPSPSRDAGRARGRHAFRHRGRSRPALSGNGSRAPYGLYGFDSDTAVIASAAKQSSPHLSVCPGSCCFLTELSCHEADGGEEKESA